MIHISSVTASVLPIQGDHQAEGATEPTISAEFATLLAAQSLAVGPAPDMATKEAFIQPPAKEALGGKPGGKVLPLPAMPDAAFPAEIVMEPASDAKGLPAAPGPADTAAPSADPALAQPFGLPIALATAMPTVQFLALPAPEPGRTALDLKPANPGNARRPEWQRAGAAAQTPLPQPAASIEGEPVTQPAFARPPVEIRLPLTAPLMPTLFDAIEPAAATSASVPEVPATGSPVATVAQAKTAVELAGTQPKPARPKGGEQANAISLSRAARPSPAAADSLAATTDEPPAPPAMPAPAQGPGTATPAGAGAPAQVQNRIEAPADFSALVDRLVAAREAAQASNAPLAVHAAIAHAEFGHVSLRFEQRDGMLNVAMTSPDPDFARSVLAAAPASQQGADNNSDNRGGPARQDAGQPMSQPQAQTQGQANGQGAHRSHHHNEQTAPHHRQPGSAGSEATGGDRPSRRRGIFA